MSAFRATGSGNQKIELLRLLKPLQFSGIRFKIFKIIAFERSFHHNRNAINNHIQKTANHQSYNENVQIIKKGAGIVKMQDFVHVFDPKKTGTSVPVIIQKRFESDALFDNVAHGKNRKVHGHNQTANQDTQYNHNERLKHT